MKEISRAIAAWCSRNSDNAVYSEAVTACGVELMLNTFSKILVLLLLGAAAGKLGETVLTLAVFGGMRYFAGGYHCSTDAGCLGFMLCMCLAAILLEQAAPPAIFLAPVLSFAVCGIVRYAPRNSAVNPVTDSRVLLRKRRGSLICLALLVTVIFMIQPLGMKWLVAAPLFIEALTVSEIFNKRRTKHETR